MANRKTVAKKVEKVSPRCAVYAAKGIKTANDFASMMSALMSDLIEGRIDGNVGNAVCNAGGKMLKVVEMQHRYGKSQMGHTGKMLELVPMISDDTVQ